MKRQLLKLDLKKIEHSEIPSSLHAPRGKESSYTPDPGFFPTTQQTQATAAENKDGDKLPIQGLSH
jgi:hypothetical protein